MCFELISLHRVYWLEIFHLGHEVLVHVEQDIFDLDDDISLQIPHFGDLFQQVFVVGHINEFLGNRLEHFDGGLLDVVVKHFTVFVQDEVVGRSVELFVGQRRGFLGIDLDDGISDGVPMLESLVAIERVVPNAVISHEHAPLLMVVGVSMMAVPTPAASMPVLIGPIIVISTHASRIIVVTIHFY